MGLLGSGAIGNSSANSGILDFAEVRGGGGGVARGTLVRRWPTSTPLLRRGRRIAAGTEARPLPLVRVGAGDLSAAAVAGARLISVLIEVVRKDRARRLKYVRFWRV